jgi:hypothetical protein
MEHDGRIVREVFHGGPTTDPILIHLNPAPNFIIYFSEITRRGVFLSGSLTRISDVFLISPFALIDLPSSDLGRYQYWFQKFLEGIGLKCCKSVACVYIWSCLLDIWPTFTSWNKLFIEHVRGLEFYPCRFYRCVSTWHAITPFELRHPLLSIESCCFVTDGSVTKFVSVSRTKNVQLATSLFSCVPFGTSYSDTF